MKLVLSSLFLISSIFSFSASAQSPETLVSTYGSLTAGECVQTISSRNQSASQSQNIIDTLASTLGPDSYVLMNNDRSASQLNDIAALSFFESLPPQMSLAQWASNQAQARQNASGGAVGGWQDFMPWNWCLDDPDRYVLCENNGGIGIHVYRIEQCRLCMKEATCLACARYFSPHTDPKEACSSAPDAEPVRPRPRPVQAR